MAERTQPVQNRHVEAAEASRLGIDVQRVVVAGEAIDLRLVVGDARFDRDIRLALRHGDLLRIGAPGALERNLTA